MVRANVFSPGVLFLCSYLYPCTWVWPFQVRAQKKMLQRFEKTNEMLTNVNTLSATRFVNNGHSYTYLPHLFSPRLDRATTDFKKHTAIVVDMKKDLDSIFRRIRNIKASLWCFPQVLDQMFDMIIILYLLLAILCQTLKYTGKTCEADAWGIWQCWGCREEWRGRRWIRCYDQVTLEAKQSKAKQSKAKQSNPDREFHH